MGTFCTRSVYSHQQSHSSALCYTQETNRKSWGEVGWWGRGVSYKAYSQSPHATHRRQTGSHREGGGLLQGLQSLATRYTPAHSKQRLASPTVPHVPKTQKPPNKIKTLSSLAPFSNSKLSSLFSNSKQTNKQTKNKKPANERWGKNKANNKMT